MCMCLHNILCQLYGTGDILSGAWLKLSIVRLPDESKFALGQVNTRVHVQWIKYCNNHVFSF